MEPDTVIRIGREALLLTMILSALPVLSTMVVGLVISLVQATIQLQEQTLSQVPKIIVVYVVLMAGGMWMLAQLMQFAVMMLQGIGDVGRGAA